MPRILRWTLVLPTLLVMVPLASGSSRLKPGSLDPTFGSGGVTTTSIGSGAAADAVAVQPDGKIIAAGGSLTPSNVPRFNLVRYKANGSLDTSFGQGGIVTTDFGSATGITAVVLQPDGKIIAAGSETNDDFALARYNINGSLDPSFGMGGEVMTTGAAFGPEAWASALALQPDGKIIAAGVAWPGGSSRDSDFALARYNPNGSLDTSFGGGGIVTTDFYGADDRANALLLQPDGKIVAVGQSEMTHYGSGFALARYKVDGSLDSSFGTSGRVLAATVGCCSEAYAAALQPDGKIVAAGEAMSGTLFALARFNADGSFDSSFGTRGKLTTDFGWEFQQVNGIALQPGGKIVAAGTVERGNVQRFALARYEPNGKLDRYFGRRGRMTSLIGMSSAAQAVTLESGARILVAGRSREAPAEEDFALDRYFGGNLRCVVPDVAGKTVAPAAKALERANCELGSVHREFSPHVARLHVISTRPHAHTTHPAGTKVTLIVSKGPR